MGLSERLAIAVTMVPFAALVLLIWLVPALVVIGATAQLELSVDVVFWALGATEAVLAAILGLCFLVNRNRV